MRILAIDGNSIMNRAFYGIRMLTTSKGVYTNAVTGFMNIYLKEIAEVEPDCTAVAFDLRAPTFRHKADASYKANRKGMPEELAYQMPLIKKLLRCLGVKIIECEGYEADDILGTVSKIFGGENDECFILTGDRDSLQLITERCTVRLATNRETINYTPERFRRDYGFEPIQLIQLKALMGDSSDNISGVKGIGEKTASALIKENGSVDKLYENLDNLNLAPSVRKKLEAGYDDAKRSEFLATICLDAPIEKDISAYENTEKDIKTLKEMLAELEMNKLFTKLISEDEESPAPETSDSAQKFEPLPTDELTAENMPDGDSAFTFDGKTLAVSYCGGILHTADENTIISYFSSEHKKKCFDAKTAHRYAFEHGSQLVGVVFSCDIAGYLLNSQASEYTAENLCARYHVTYRSDMNEYAAAASVSELSERLETELEALEMSKLYYDIELPLCEVLASMEFYGVYADTEGIKKFGEEVSEELDGITKQIYELAGQQFNIASPKQLGKILFEDLGLPCKKKTKSGYSTNAEVLAEIEDKHPIIPLILRHRTLSKLSSTYVDSLLKQVHEDGRVHSIFKQTETRTGRISSTEPNMQNIPVRKEIGRQMRKFFTAEDGFLLVDADYSQIELRVLAGICGDKNMQESFLSGKDIHTSTAAQVFDIPEDMVAPEMRSAAKAVNFGIIYGIGAYSLSKDIGVSVAEANRYIKNYLNNFPKVSEFMDNTVENAMKCGYVTTIFGRRRYIPELHASNKVTQAFGKRAAMNAPIQGAAADIIKLAMVRVYKRLKEELSGARLILQVHDELIIEAPEELAPKAAKILKEEMESVVKLDVPMIADVHLGKSWYDAKG